MNAIRIPLTLMLLALIAAAQAPGPPKEGNHMSNFTLATPAFGSGAAIPDAYTCSGTDVSPVLSWTGEPASTASFALVMDDPDAPAGTWVHWVIWNVPRTTHLLPRNVMKSGTLPDGGMQGKNGFGKIGYNGPCPPPGKKHRYFFRLYALDTKLTLPPGASREQLDTAMKGHVIAKAEHMGAYQR
jgi:Raf kinase inhibitor-like YbhB/YbcL family protein